MNGKQISTSLSSEKNLSKRSHSERSETTKLVKRLVCIKLPSVSIPLQGESGYEENSKSVLAGQGENHLSLTEPKTRVLRSRVITVLPQTQLSRRNRKCGNGNGSTSTSLARTPRAGLAMKKCKDSILSKRKAQRELSEEPTKCKLEKRVDLKPSSLTPIAAKRSHLTRKTKKRHSAKRLKAESSPQKKSKSQKKCSEKKKKKTRSATMNQRSVRLAEKRSSLLQSVTTPVNNAWTVARNPTSSSSALTKRITHWNGNQVVVHTARTEHQLWLPDKNVISDRVESYGRVGDIPIYSTEDKQAIHEDHNFHSGYWAKEVVPMAYLTKGQIKELKKRGFELTSVPVPKNPTPIQKLAVHDVTADYARSKRSLKVDSSRCYSLGNEF
ncbi:hypothetical protein V3C99_000325 [Haemonchus contortus]